jgi:hypothetical protein
MLVGIKLLHFFVGYSLVNALLIYFFIQLIELKIFSSKFSSQRCAIGLFNEYKL